MLRIATPTQNCNYFSLFLSLTQETKRRHTSILFTTKRHRTENLQTFKHFICKAVSTILNLLFFILFVRKRSCRSRTWKRDLEHVKNSPQYCMVF